MNTKKLAVLLFGFFSGSCFADGCVSGNCYNGEGTYIWEHFFSHDEKFVGTWESGKKKIGEYTCDNGNRYYGEWSSNDDLVKITSALFISPNNEEYYGNIRNCEPHGKGKISYASGNKYEGEFSDGRKNGQGIFYWKDGDKYEGSFSYDSRTGYGTYTFASGTKYVGMFTDNKFHGQGTMYYTNGTQNAGEWDNDEFMTPEKLEERRKKVEAARQREIVCNSQITMCKSQCEGLSDIDDQVEKHLFSSEKTSPRQRCKRTCSNSC
jgi:hypothetical protein